jgi:hypothetical protein
MLLYDGNLFQYINEQEHSRKRRCFVQAAIRPYGTRGAR